MRMNLSIVIPSYNARALLRRALTTLEVTLKAVAPDAEVILVDGRSQDGSFEMVKEEFPWVHAYTSENHGFAHAVNRGLERASHENLLLLNSDLFLGPEALTAMLARLADPKVGAVAPQLVNEDGSKQRLFGAFGALYWANWLPVREPSPVPLLSFACLMTRRSVLLEVGAFDENFFLYNEEYDWCVRARRAGYRFEILPESVVHVGAGSTTPSPELVLEAQRGFLYFTKKHGSPQVAEFLRRAMQFEGYCYQRIDPRSERHRAIWAKLHSLTTREAYLESPFPLSGRGDAPARPHWRGVSLHGASPGMNGPGTNGASQGAYAHSLSDAIELDAPMPRAAS
jgi:N-acetylglucosaminyl-diphospho-decaprenol L-rhamnosyltransferase